MSDCSYGTRCHYSHEPLKKAFRCFQCGEEFNNRGEMMIHRKKVHVAEDCKSFLKDGNCRYNERCWWSHPFEAEGFWGTTQTPTPPNRRNQATEQQRTLVQSVEKITKKEDLMLKIMNVMNQLMNMQMGQ